MPSISPDMTIRICRWVKPSFSGGFAVEVGEFITGQSSGAVSVQTFLAMLPALPAKMLVRVRTAVCNEARCDDGDRGDPAPEPPAPAGRTPSRTRERPHPAQIAWLSGRTTATGS